MDVLTGIVTTAKGVPDRVRVPGPDGGQGRRREGHVNGGRENNSTSFMVQRKVFRAGHYGGRSVSGTLGPGRPDRRNTL